MRRVVVIPCFNEAERLDATALLALVEPDDTDALFVDDGSTDGTREVLMRLAARAPGRVTVLGLATNVGKGEAVRQGLRAAVDAGADIVAYLDADLATPVDELRRIIDVIDARPSVAAAIGARVALLGSAIERRATRHYLGRVFATAASMTLGVAIYDTQCGAKAFRAGPALSDALATPFASRWAFDVELLARLMRTVSEDAIVEVPLRRWRDVAGSKLSATKMVTAGVDLARLAFHQRRRR